MTCMRIRTLCSEITTPAERVEFLFQLHREELVPLRTHSQHVVDPAHRSNIHTVIVHKCLVKNDRVKGGEGGASVNGAADEQAARRWDGDIQVSRERDKPSKTVFYNIKHDVRRGTAAIWPSSCKERVQDFKSSNGQTRAPLPASVQARAGQ